MYDPRYNPVQFQKADARMFNSGAKMQQDAMSTLLGMTQKIQGQEKEFQDKMVLDNTAKVINQINRQATQGDLDIMALPDENSVDLNALNAAMQQRGSVLYNQGQDTVKNTLNQDKFNELTGYHKGQLENSKISANASLMNANTSRGNLGLNMSKFKENNRRFEDSKLKTVMVNGVAVRVPDTVARELEYDKNISAQEKYIELYGTIEDKTNLEKIKREDTKKYDPDKYTTALSTIYSPLKRKKTTDAAIESDIYARIQKEASQQKIEDAGISTEQIANRKLSSALWNTNSKELEAFESSHKLNDGEGLDISAGAKKALIQLGLTKNDVDFAGLMSLIANGIGKKGEILNGTWFAGQNDAKDIALSLLRNKRGKALILKSGKKTQNQLLNLVDENKNEELTATIQKLKKDAEEYKKALAKNNIVSQHPSVNSWGRPIMVNDFFNNYE